MKIQHFRNKGVLQSVWPPESYFGFSVWALLIPPFKPESVLLLGYGHGTVAGLMRKVWGDGIMICGVDQNIPKAVQGPFKFFKGDAFNFVRNCQEKYDYVLVDLFDGGFIPEEVWSEEFVNDLARVTKRMLCVNTLGTYQLFYYQKRFRQILTKQWFDNRALFFVPNESQENFFPPIEMS